MTQDEKELLLKDLSARVPYEVKIRVEYPYLKEEEWHPEILCWSDLLRLCVANTSIILEEFKPYLFPMSSMSDEQIDELKDLCDMYDPVNDNDDYEDWGTCLMTKHFMEDEYHFKFNFKLFEFLNKNRLDYRGLISMGLAIDATGLNIY